MIHVQYYCYVKFPVFVNRNSFYMESFVVSLISLPIIMTVLVAIRHEVVNMDFSLESRHSQSFSSILVVNLHTVVS